MTEAIEEKCSYFGCGKLLSNHGLKGFPFPVDDPGRCNRWIRNSGNTDLLQLSSSDLSNRFICESHFKSEDFEKENIRCDALPIDLSNNIISTKISDKFNNVFSVDDEEIGGGTDLPTTLFDSGWDDGSDSNGLHFSKKAKLKHEDQLFTDHLQCNGKKYPDLEHISGECHTNKNGNSTVKPEHKLTLTPSLLKPTTQNSWGKRKRNKKSKAGKLCHEKRLVKKMVSSIVDEILNDVISRVSASSGMSSNDSATRHASEKSSITTTERKKTRMKTTKIRDDPRKLITSPGTSSVSGEKKTLDMKIVEDLEEERIKRYREKVRKQRMEAISEARALQDKLTIIDSSILRNGKQSCDDSTAVHSLEESPPSKKQNVAETITSDPSTVQIMPSTIDDITKENVKYLKITLMLHDDNIEIRDLNWFYRSLRECRRVCASFNKSSMNLSKLQDKSSGVECSAQIHNSLQEVLCSAINNFIDIRKISKLEFIQGNTFTGGGSHRLTFLFDAAMRLSHDMSLVNGKVIIKTRREKQKATVGAVPKCNRPTKLCETVPKATMASKSKSQVTVADCDKTGIFLMKPPLSDIVLKKNGIPTVYKKLPSFVVKPGDVRLSTTKTVWKEVKSYKGRKKNVKPPTDKSIASAPTSSVCATTPAETQTTSLLKTIPISAIQLSAANNPPINIDETLETSKLTKILPKSDRNLNSVPMLKTVPKASASAPDQLQTKTMQNMVSLPTAHTVDNVIYALHQTSNNVSVLYPLRIENIVPVQTSEASNSTALDSVQILEGSVRTLDPMETEEELKVDIDELTSTNGETVCFMDTDLDEKPSITSFKSDPDDEVNVS